MCTRGWKRFEANFGGEPSGHILTTDRSTTGDGCLTAVWLAVSLVTSRRRKTDWMPVFTPVPQVLKNVRFDGGKPLENAAVQDVIVAPRDQQGRLRLPRGWKGDGVIASLRNRPAVQHVKRLGVPVVDVSIMVQKEDWFARLATDDQSRGRLAVEHLRSRGIEHFACYSPPIGRYAAARSHAFRSAVEASGGHCAMYSAADGESCGWLTNYTKAKQWLATLPKPLGVFAADPYPARQLVEICGTASIRIPEQVAVISGDDDELLCNIATPRISSVELASHRIGESAASMLQRWMDGTRAAPAGHID